VAFGPASVLADIPGAVGYVGPGVVVEALDEAGEVLPAGKEGDLRIRTPYLVDGYIGDEEATRQAFRDGFFYSGDIGQVTADGIMIVSGRKKTILNLGGASVNPERIEALLKAYIGVREAAALSLDNELGIAESYALIVADVPIDEAALVAYCKSSMPSAWVPRRIFQIEQLPTGGQGKIERHRLREIAKTRLAASSTKRE
jgi:long-chain acyl-CoA synthetase